MQRLDLTGQKFEHLTALEFIPPRKWLCRCSCGNEVLVFTDNLRRGHTKSCGCHKSTMITNSKIKHGHTTSKGRKSKAYNAWMHMKMRCVNPNDEHFSLYGGRGIKVCDEWMRSYEQFFADMGEPPTSRHSLDRINVNGDYEPGNCRWVTQKIQTNNQRRNLYFTYQGETHTLKEWCEIKKLSYDKVRQRIQRLNWSFERAISEP